MKIHPRAALINTSGGRAEDLRGTSNIMLGWGSFKKYHISKGELANILASVCLRTAQDYTILSPKQQNCYCQRRYPLSHIHPHSHPHHCNFMNSILCHKCSHVIHYITDTQHFNLVYRLYVYDDVFCYVPVHVFSTFAV